ncbi:MAG: CehA/McbA family metallohydrolase [Myxococcota bacterium]
MRCSHLLAGLGLALGACDAGERSEIGAKPGSATVQVTSEQPDPATARRQLVVDLRAAAARAPHPADGGGRAWLDVGETARTAQVGRPRRFVLVYEVGPLGIATGGAIHLQVSPFWEWSTPQVEVPRAPGYTRIEASAPDIEFEARTQGDQLLSIEVTGRSLVEGERIRFFYGDGPAGAMPDRYAEKNSRFWFAVDGDGDGHRAFLADSPGIDVVAGPPARLVVHLPSTARPGQPVRVDVAVVDARGNAGPEFVGVIRFDSIPEGLDLPESIDLAAGDRARGSVEGVAREPGVYRLEAFGPGGLSERSNPLVVSEDGPRVLWGDLHGHSGLSDGTGTPSDFFDYARNVASLDVVALTDHDHWGILPLDDNPQLWREIREEVRRVNEPGRFVSVLGYEWTSWIHGHRHVLYFEDDGDVISSLPPETESPRQLWAALAGRPALTFAHHSAGGPIATNWDIPPDPAFEPVTEIVSVHGSSEAQDSPGRIYDAVKGNFVRDVLDRGYRLGFIGSGDSHDGHPGLAHLDTAGAGLAAILSEDLTREAVLKAIRARRVYATNGPRILLRTALGGYGMGMGVPVSGEAEPDQELFIHVVAVGPLERVELIRSGAVVDAASAGGRLEVVLHRPIENLRPGEYLYVRAVQRDGGAAWSSPFFIE